MDYMHTTMIEPCLKRERQTEKGRGREREQRLLHLDVGMATAVYFSFQRLPSSRELRFTRLI